MYSPNGETVTSEGTEFGPAKIHPVFKNKVRVESNTLSERKRPLQVLERNKIFEGELELWDSREGKFQM